VTYGAEKWTLTSKMEKMLMICERKILRKIYGPTKENGQWRIKTNEEFMTKYKAPDIVNVIKIRRLEWLVHVVRMNETRSVNKIFEGKLEGRRSRGRPRVRWINDVEDDLRKLCETMENEGIGKRGMGINYKENQGQTERGIEL
jgi:hypothetical protein